MAATPKGLNHPLYVYFLLKWLDLHRWRSGSGQPLLNQSTINSIDVSIHTPDEQERVARILGALHDKIELNRQMNETLEATARAVFKSWFVDFDPVRAKLDGRQPHGMNAETAALFPDRFEHVDGELVPAGWKKYRLSGLVSFEYGKALKKDNRVPGPIVVMGSNGPVGTHDQKLADGPGIVVGRKGNPGTVEWVDSDFFPIDTTFYVRLKDPLVSLPYCEGMLRTLDLPGLSADSAVPGLNRNIAYMSETLCPGQPLQLAFDLLVSPLKVLAAANAAESQTLAELRDTLLPKLLSGELSVGGLVDRLTGEGVDDG